jgi:hypothetical protein
MSGVFEARYRCLKGQIMPKEKDQPYVMPRPTVGFCVWYPARTGYDPVPAIITQVGIGSLNLTVWPPDNRGGLPTDGVRHISDPSVDKMTGYAAGVWDFSDDTKKLHALEKSVAAVLAAFGDQPPTG